MENLIIQQVISFLAPIVLSAAAGALGWAGYEGGKFIRTKTGNEKAAAAIEQFGQAIAGAVAQTEATRLQRPLQLSDYDKIDLRNTAISRAMQVVGQPTLAALESQYGDFNGLAIGMVEDAVAKITTNKRKVAAMPYTN